MKVLANTGKRPVVDRYPDAGAVLPYLTRKVDGRNVAVAVDDEDAERFDGVLGSTAVEIPPGLETVPLRG